MNLFKQCSLCREEKLLHEFNNCKETKDGKKHYCKICFREKYQQSEKYKIYDRARALIYKKSNKQKIKNYYKNNNNPRIALKQRKDVRDLLNCGGKIYSPKIGCTGAEFRIYIESLFTPEMTWDSNNWVLSYHVSPLEFNLSNLEERYKAFNFKNIYPKLRKLSDKVD